MAGLRSKCESGVCRLAGLLGLDLVRRSELLRDIGQDDAALMEDVRRYTMTGPERLHALVQAVRYIVAAEVPGDVVECGVWRGGSMMAVATQLLRCGPPTRRLWLYDTFEGMTAPTDVDVDIGGRQAWDLFDGKAPTGEEGSSWYAASLDDVRSNMERTGYPSGLVSYVAGPVERTLPGQAPDRIALLRLDTDWYTSTKVELATLFPRLAPGGILIIDDYGHWGGCRRAVDEYLREQEVTLLLNRIDYTGRIAVKPPSPLPTKSARP
jgi:O-methyltransferase